MRVVENRARRFAVTDALGKLHVHERYTTFLDSNGWRELAVMHSRHGNRPGSVFHHFSDDQLTSLLVEDLAGNNGIAIWVPLNRDTDSARIAAVREFVSALHSQGKGSTLTGR